MSIVALYQGDALSTLRGWKAGSVDLVVCSPPYEAARTYGIDFNLRGDAWVQWAADRYMECLRVCRGMVVWVVEGQTRKYEWSATPVLLMAELKRRGAVLRKPAVFHRVGIPGSGGPDWLRNDWEWCVCATGHRGKLPWSDNTVMGHTPKWGPGGAMSNRHADGRRLNVNQWGASGKSMKTRRRNGDRQSAGRPSHVFGNMRVAAGTSETGEAKPNRTVPFPSKANPGNVLHHKVGGGVMGDRLCHENEAPFPEKLAEFWIRSFCPPGGTVLDPFLGSGTTAAVAVKHRRNAVGIDIRASQIDLSERRLTRVGVPVEIRKPGARA